MSKELENKIWVKEQEISTLKVQNRHLIAKLEEAEKAVKASPQGQLDLSLLKNLSDETLKHHVTSQLKIEKALAQAFEMMQSTLRGVYQQSQRAQQAVDTLTAHSRDLEIRIQESRKADQTFYQDKIFGLLTSFGDRIERQISQRMDALSSIEVVIAKQNEMLNDIERLKTIMTHQQSEKFLKEYREKEKANNHIEDSISPEA